MSDLIPSLLLTLRIAVCATLIVALIGVPLAYAFARRRFFGKSVIETILAVPIVLPPTVIGYLLLLTFGVRGPVGSLLFDWFGVRVMFTQGAAVLASVVVSFPLLLLPARAAFASVEPEFEEIARIMGAGPIQIFWHVSLPLARRGIGSGLLLAFARSLGEFGATVMVFGSAEGRTTLSVSIYQDFISRELGHAWPAVAFLTGASFAVIVLYNRAWRGLGGR